MDILTSLAPSMNDFIVIDKELIKGLSEKEVELEHNQNFFRVQFSALDFVNNENIMYRYKLEGIDQDWNYTKAGQSINYTNLSRGTYTLLLSSTNNHNLWITLHSM